MTQSKLDRLFSAMWQDYLQINPQAREIFELFAKQNDPIVNDHIALRTFDLPEVDISILSRPFTELGYNCCGEYHFPVKKLYAQHFEHRDPLQPKIFISQLLTEEISPDNRKIIRTLVDQIPVGSSQQDNFCYSGRPWPVSYATYQQLLAESEYAAWMAAFGFRPNHFTILVNHLTSHPGIAAVNTFLLEQGYPLNTAGGEIKGSPEELLEQSSTLANPVAVDFCGEKKMIPGCYYEFAYRYPDQNGQLFQGFVAQSADKIFQSTDTR